MGFSAILACGETLVQVSEADVVEVRLSNDSLEVAIARTVQLRAYPLDAAGGLLIGLAVAWESDDALVATVDDAGLVSGAGAGTTNVIARVGTRADTAIVSVDFLPALSLSADSVGFDVVAGGADPAPDSIEITNAGGLTLDGLRVDSTTYEGTAGWLSAQLTSPSAPATLVLTAVPSGITAADVYSAFVWLSATDAEGSPAVVTATLEVAPGAPLSSGFQIVQGNGQTAVIGTAVAVQPTVSLRDQFNNPVPGATITFAASGDGIVAPVSVMTDQNGLASTTWTVSDAGHTMTSEGTYPNMLTAMVIGLNPLQFSASARYSYATHVDPLWAPGGCTGCHGGFSGLELGGTAAENYAELVNVVPVCGQGGLAQEYRVVSSAGGVDAADVYSVLMRPDAFHRSEPRGDPAGSLRLDR
jgi:hypothetical protein